MDHLTHDQVLEIIGEIDAIKTAEIIATGASLKEVEEAAVWAKGINRLGQDLHRPLSGRVAEIYSILTSNEGYDDVDRP